MTSFEARVSKRPHEDAPILYSSNHPCGSPQDVVGTAQDDHKRCCRRSSYELGVPSTIIEQPFPQQMLLRQQESSLSFQSTTTEQSDTIQRGDDSSDKNDDADDEMECCTSSEDQHDDGDDEKEERLSMEISQQTMSQATHHDDSVSTRMMVDDLSTRMDQSWTLTNLKAWRRRLSSSLSDNNDSNANNAAISQDHDQHSQATSRTSNNNNNNNTPSNYCYRNENNDDNSFCSIEAINSNQSTAAGGGGGGLYRLDANLRNTIRMQQKAAKRQVMSLLRGRANNDTMGMVDDEENRTFQIK